MKREKISAILALSCFFSAQGFAEQAWITDDLRTGVQNGPTRNAGFSGTLVAGSPVERLEESDDGEYTRIRSAEVEGWVLTRNLTDQPSMRSLFDQQRQSLQAARATLDKMQNNDEQASVENMRLREELNAAKEQAQRSRDELLSLQRASENVVQIDSLNRELQDKVVSLEQANLQLTQQNTLLSEQSHHRQMIIGGALVLGGMVIFWLLSLLGSARRRSTFNDF